MNDITNKRKELEDIIEKYNLDITLNDIPNLSKYNSLNNEKKVIDTIINIEQKLNTNNIDRKKEIFKRKEFKYELLQFKLINNDNDSEIDKYLETKINNNTSAREDDKLLILDTFYEEKNNFKDLIIPTMGLVNNNKIVEIKSEDIFN